MRAIAIPVLLAASLCRAAHAGPEPLDDAGLAGVAAGLFDTYLVVQVVSVDNRNTSATDAVGSSGASSNAVSNVTVNNVVDVSPTDAVGHLPPVTVAVPASGGRPSLAPPAATVPAAVPSAPPVWVPWAAELRPALGLR